MRTAGTRAEGGACVPTGEVLPELWASGAHRPEPDIGFRRGRTDRGSSVPRGYEVTHELPLQLACGAISAFQHVSSEADVFHLVPMSSRLMKKSLVNVSGRCVVRRAASARSRCSERASPRSGPSSRERRGSVDRSAWRAGEPGDRGGRRAARRRALYRKCVVTAWWFGSACSGRRLSTGRGQHPGVPVVLLVRLTAAFGRHSDEPTGDDLRCAVVNHIPESVDLDWRKEFYPGADADGKDLAKDVPATVGTADGKAVIQRWRPQAGPRPLHAPLRPSAGPRRRADPLSTREPARGRSPGQRPQSSASTSGTARRPALSPLSGGRQPQHGALTGRCAARARRSARRRSSGSMPGMRLFSAMPL